MKFSDLFFESLHLARVFTRGGSKTAQNSETQSPTVNPEVVVLVRGPASLLNGDPSTASKFQSRLTNLKCVFQKSHLDALEGNIPLREKLITDRWPSGRREVSAPMSSWLTHRRREPVVRHDFCASCATPRRRGRGRDEPAFRLDARSAVQVQPHVAALLVLVPSSPLTTWGKCRRVSCSSKTS